MTLGILLPPQNITPKSLIKVTRIMEMLPTKEACDCSTNSPCQYLRKIILNSMKNMDTDVRVNWYRSLLYLLVWGKTEATATLVAFINTTNKLIQSKLLLSLPACWGPKNYLTELNLFGIIDHFLLVIGWLFKFV